MEKITTIAQLEQIIGTEQMECIIYQHQIGDPDWLFDLIDEFDEGITKDARFFLPEIHGAIQAKGIQPGWIDAYDIDQEIKTLLNKPINYWLRVVEKKGSTIGFESWVCNQGNAFAPHIEALRKIINKK